MNKCVCGKETVTKYCSVTCGDRDRQKRYRDKAKRDTTVTPVTDKSHPSIAEPGEALCTPKCPFIGCKETSVREGETREVPWDGNKEGYCAKHYLKYTDSSSWNRCTAKGCNLPQAPGHDDMCIYHWRQKEHLPRITKKEYEKING